jgi:hypothetical protein
MLWKQGLKAARTSADKYEHYRVHPQHGAGPITIGAHVAIWNRLLPGEIMSIWTAGQLELRGTAMYHSYA